MNASFNDLEQVKGVGEETAKSVLSSLNDKNIQEIIARLRRPRAKITLSNGIFLLSFTALIKLIAETSPQLSLGNIMKT